MDFEKREEQLALRLSRIDALEKEIKAREAALKTNESAKKQVLLRLAGGLWNDIAAWAEDDFRSINSQIEYLLAEAVKERKRGK